MACRHGAVKSVSLSDNFIFTELVEKGRLQYFFHSPSSGLPVRDVSNEQGKGSKTEPHIEIGAENYINCCYQPNNILRFLRSKEKYLFLFTTCKNEKRGDDYCNERFIVGYIAKQNKQSITLFQKTKEYCVKQRHCPAFEKCDGRYVIKGDVKIFGFKDAFPLKRLIIDQKKRKNIRVRKVSKSETKKILSHLENKQDILSECIREIKKLDKNNETCLRDKEECKFKDECLRWCI